MDWPACIRSAVRADEEVLKPVWYRHKIVSQAHVATLVETCGPLFALRGKRKSTT
jgi:hypothetical protein